MSQARIVQWFLDKLAGNVKSSADYTFTFQCYVRLKLKLNMLALFAINLINNSKIMYA